MVGPDWGTREVSTARGLTRKGVRGETRLDCIPEARGYPVREGEKGGWIWVRQGGYDGSIPPIL